MDCNVCEKNLIGLIKGTLKGNAKRRTYYHLEGCPKCREQLLDEFSFYTTFNDLDTDLDFNYNKRLNEFLQKVKFDIEGSDLNTTALYMFLSILICVGVAGIMVVALLVVYK